MSTICQVYSLYAGELWLGRRDEGGMRSVAIDVSPWLADLDPSGTFMLAVSRPGEDDSPYNPAIVFDGAKIIWTPDDVDTAIAGTGTAELRYYVGTNKIKSKAFKTIIAAAPFTMLTPPSAIEPFVERIEQAAANATAASASAAISAATATEQADTATTKASEASTSASEADASADAASASATNAAGSATAAAQSATAASNAADDATESEQIAAAAANAATAASGTATTKAAEAAQSVTAAAQSATSASSSAGDAEQAATTATAKAQEASTSASGAAASADAASSSATSAASSATAASDARTVAEAARAAAQAARTGAESAQSGAENARTGAENAQSGAESAQAAAEQAAASVSASAAQIATNTSDITALKEDLYDLQIVNTASGAVASFSDGSNGFPVRSLTVGIEPVQSGSGDPSPTNVRPISGWDAVEVTRTGKNLFDVSTATSQAVNASGTSSATYGYKSDNTLIFQLGLYSASVFFPFGGIYLHAGDTFTLSADVLLPTKTNLTSNQVYMRLRCSSESVMAGNVTTTVIGTTTRLSVTATVATEGLYDMIGIQAAGNAGAYSSLNCQVSNIQVELGSSATDYEPYTGSSSTLTLPSTVYGGTVDAVSGEGTVDRAIIDLGTLTWYYNSSLGCFYSSGIVSVVAGGNKDKLACTAYKPITQTLTSSVIQNGDYIIGVNKYSSGSAESGSFVAGTLVVKDSRYTDADSFTTAVSGVYLVYPLATPATFSVTPVTDITTLYGFNIIYANSGDIESVEYVADTKLYIDSLTAPDDDMVADANISSGDYFIVNNKLYVATAAIASGETIVPGSNCTLTDLASALNALNA